MTGLRDVGKSFAEGCRWVDMVAQVADVSLETKVWDAAASGTAHYQSDTQTFERLA